MELWGAALFGQPCRECGFDWDLSPADAMVSVTEFVDRARTAAAGLTGDERLAGWSIAEYVAHVGDNLRQWAERVQAARLAGRTEVAGYDPGTLAMARRYDAIPLEVALWSTAHAVEQWVQVLTAALAERVELQHASRGLQRAQDIVRNNSHDAYHHLRDIEQIAAGLNARCSGRHEPVPHDPQL